MNRYCQKHQNNRTYFTCLDWQCQNNKVGHQLCQQCIIEAHQDHSQSIIDYKKQAEQLQFTKLIETNKLINQLGYNEKIWTQYVDDQQKNQNYYQFHEKYRSLDIEFIKIEVEDRQVVLRKPKRRPLMMDMMDEERQELQVMDDDYNIFGLFYGIDECVEMRINMGLSYRWFINYNSQGLRFRIGQVYQYREIEDGDKVDQYLGVGINRQIVIDGHSHECRASYGSSFIQLNIEDQGKYVVISGA